MKDTLSSILATGSIPADLLITYDDMHGLWVGVTISVRGDGSVERRTATRGAVTAHISHTSIDQLINRSCST